MLYRGFARNNGRLEVLGKCAELIEVLADNKHVVGMMLFNQFLADTNFSWIGRSDAVLVSFRRDGILESQICRQRHANLRAYSLGDPALFLEHLPRHVVLFGPDQAEYVVLAGVLTHQRGRQAEPSLGLYAGSGAKYRRGQEMHFIINNETPLPLVEYIEVNKGAVLGLAIGKHLVSGNGNGSYRFLVAAVFADVVLAQGGFVQQLVLPLMQRDRVRGQYKGMGLGCRNGPDGDHRFSGAAGQYHDAAAAAIRTIEIKSVHGLALIGAQFEGASAQGNIAKLNIERCAVGVARKVLDGKPKLDQRAFDVAPVFGIDDYAFTVGGNMHILAQQVVSQQFADKHRFFGFKNQTALFAAI